MYGVYRDAQLQFNSSTETSTDHNTEPSLDIESMYKDSLYSHQVQKSTTGYKEAIKITNICLITVYWCTAKKDKIVENTCNTKI